jgi:hypothetical protein
MSPILQIEVHSDFPHKLIEGKQVPVFCSSEYAEYLLKTVSQKMFWFTGFLSDDTVCIIPFSITKKAIFKKGTFLSSVIFGNESYLSLEKEFLELVIKHIAETKMCDWIQQPPNWAIFRTVPDNSIFCQFGTYRIDLKADENIKLLKKMHRDHRQHIIHATKNKAITIKRGPELISDCIEVFSLSTAGKNVDLPSKRDLEILVETLPDNVQIYVAYYNSKPQSSVIYFWDKLSYYAVYAGMVSDPVEGINHLLHWQAMLDAKCDGVRFYDFVGSRVNPLPGTKHAGLKRFKSHFGGEFIQGYLWKLPLSKVKYYICCCFTRIKSILKLKYYRGDIIDQELRQIKRSKKLVKV